MSVSDSVMDATVTPTWHISELLCFITSKCNIMALDDLVEVCADFYTEVEVVNARDIIDSCGVRMPKRRNGPDKLRLTVEDIARQVLNPTVKLPEFHAVNIARLPPVGATHCDVSAILLELQSLRAEVRGIGHLKSEIDDLKSQIHSLKSLQDEVVEMRKNITTCLSTHMETISPESTASSAGNDGLSAAHVVKNAAVSGALASVNRQTRVKSCVGKASASNKLKAVPTYRNVDLFVSRVHPILKEGAIIDFVDEALKSRPVCVQCVDPVIECEQLPTKYDTYSSFHVTVKVDSAVFKDVLDLLMSDEVWPMGMFVRRFFTKRNQDGAQQ